MPLATRWVAAFCVITTVLVAVAVWWVTSPSSARRTAQPTTDGIVDARDPYIGSRACRECHPGPYAAFLGSGHARTFAPADRVEAAQQLDGQSIIDPDFPGVRWTFQRNQTASNTLELVRTQDAEQKRLPLEYAFGSGHHAMTFVSLVSANPIRALEHRITWFRALGRIGITPGQRAHDGDVHGMEFGRELNADGAIKCFRCHVTRTSATNQMRIDRDTMIPRVSCERCHGPARAHVERVSAGRDDPHYRGGLDRLDAAAEMKFCGQCHRHPDEAPPGRIRADNPEIARFQPVGLMQSKCYQKSDGALRCVTCHDPHTRSASDAAVYEAICISCHSGSGKVECKVSRDRCLECHMPRIDAGQEITFADHWIRVRNDAAAHQDRSRVK